MKPHRTDSLSLFFGLVFLLISGGYFAKVYLSLTLPDLGWFIAGGLILLGIVGAVTALVPPRRPVEPSIVEEPSIMEEPSIVEEPSEPEQPR
jgi:hypothetical protein